MKIIQVPYCFYPDQVGGTEVYVAALVNCLTDRGIESIVVSPGERNDSYEHEGIRVRRFHVNPTIKDLRELYGEGNAAAAKEFSLILDEEKPDLVHLHALTRGVSLRLVREAKLRRLPVVFTYHTPTVSCQRGTLMRWGREVCDGVLRRNLCARCTLHGLGMNRISSHILGSVPKEFGRFLGRVGKSGGAWTALRMTELIQSHHTSLHQLMNEVDHIIATAEWAKEILVRNRVLPEKITVSRQGLCTPIPQSSTSKLQLSNSNLKIVFIGRMDPTKGLHILIQAMRLLPELKMSLHIYGVVQGKSGQEYEKKIHSMAKKDERIFFHSPVANQDMIHTLRTFDILAVPSQWLETGPLVILEAFAAGIPVIGSNLGSIAERVEHGVNGLLVEPDSIEAWHAQIKNLSLNRDLVEKLKKGIQPPRSMETVAQEMEELYLQCTSLKNTA